MAESRDLEKSAPFDDVDFTSGFETQYEQEYRPLNTKVNVPPTQNRETLWYRDLTTILLVLFLAGSFLLGTVFLIKIIFTSNPLYGFGIATIYVILAIAMITLEIMCLHVG